MNYGMYSDATSVVEVTETRIRCWFEKNCKTVLFEDNILEFTWNWGNTWKSSIQCNYMPPTYV